ncbi:MAG: hypothetical protein M1828_001184 [Chrysothrix sp. TS-e1954]|nr:MAG: hypothetical protein M1828_001184 [Chrysothrix sp. TS-e1954]
MSAKRPYADDDQPASDERMPKRLRKGFQVGPDNLPDGTYRRKAQRIKQNLIHKAKVRKEFSKIKGWEQERAHSPRQRTDRTAEDKEPTHPQEDEATTIENSTRSQHPGERDWREHPSRARLRQRPRHAPFQREVHAAQQRKDEAEVRRRAREEGQRQRLERIAERERFRRAMAKARSGGPNGQRKLGRESKVLLERVQRMVKS